MNKSINVGDIIPFCEYKWRVLYVQNDRALIITDNIIDKRPYNNEDIGVTWETCTLRQYLNNDFYNQFIESCQERIIETTIKNLDNLWFGTAGGNDTLDKIFLLSLEEVDEYFGNSKDYINKNIKFWDKDGCAAVDWMSNKHNRKRVANYNNKPDWWSLRTSGFRNYCATYVNGDGSISVDGFVVNYPHFGVRPTLWLKI
jgi:hypothetical protein